MTEQGSQRDAPGVRLGARLRRARLARNLTQSEVAENQFSVSYISAVERGQIRPSLGALEKLAERLHVPLSELLREDESAPIPPLPSMERGDSTERLEIEHRLREGLILSRQNCAHESIETLGRVRHRNLTSSEQASFHWYLGRGLAQLGRLDDARREILEGVAVAERAGDAELRGWLYVELGIIYSALRKHQLALEQFQVGQEAVERGQIKDPVFHLHVLYHIGDEYRHLGELGSATEALAQAATLASEISQPDVLGVAFATISASLAGQGDTRRARAYAARAAAAFEEASTQRLVNQIYTRIGTVYAQSGQTEDALVHLLVARQMAEQRRDARGAAESLRGLAMIYQLQRDIDQASQAAAEALRLAVELEDPLLEGEVLLTQAQVLGARDDTAAAERDFERAIELFKMADATQPLADAYKQYSDYLEAHGQGNRAFSLLRQAWELRDRAS